jgi:DNA helicase-2/ATP-dependent DNA helicase PcrA
MSKLLQGLNPAQQAAVTGAEGPTMIIAGAGSGKTKVLTTRIAYLLEQGIRPWEILSLTFTNKAAGEMKERISALLGSGYVNDLWMGTFHSVFARMLRRHAELLGYTRSFSIYDSDDSLALIKRVMEELRIPRDQFNPNAVRSRISSAKNQMIGVDEYANMARDFFSEKVAEVYGEYVKQLKSANAMDFDDLLIKTIELFMQHKDVLESYQRKFRYVLVDEYQDTNRAQYMIVKLLSAFHNNLTVVGDDAQSIYAFRGADIKNILDFERDYPQTKLFRLEQNYRSTGHILSVADRLIKNNKEQIPKTLFTKNLKGELVRIMECSDEREEGAAVVRTIEDEIRKERYTLSQFAVLYRTNAQSRAVEDAFRRQGIPYTIIGGIAFYKRKEIKDCLAYIRLIVNPSDAESLVRVVNFPARGIGETTMQKISQFAREGGTTMLDVMSAPEFIPNVNQRTAGKLRAFADLIAKFSKLRTELSAGELLRALIDETGILAELKLENTPESVARYENVREFLSAITEYFQDNAEATIESFLEEISLMSDVDKVDGTKNVVTLMTIHAAKGLEFQVVFITGLEEGLFPNPNTSFDDFSMEEERRLMYVAITRAMKKCYILYAKNRLRFGEYTSALPSRFVKEVIESGSTELTTSYGTKIIERAEPTRSEARDDIFSSTMFTPRGNGERVFAARKTPRREYNEYDQTYAEFSEPESSRTPSSSLKRGAKVHHEIFGEGRVIEVSGKGDKAKAVVDFNRQGRKNLMLKFANLKVL